VTVQGFESYAEAPMKIAFATAAALLSMAGAAHAESPAMGRGPRGTEEAARAKAEAHRFVAMVKWNDHYVTGNHRNRRVVVTPSVHERFGDMGECDRALEAKAVENPGDFLSCIHMVHVERPSEERRPRSRMEPADGSSPYVKWRTEPIKPEELQ